MSLCLKRVRSHIGCGHSKKQQDDEQTRIIAREITNHSVCSISFISTIDRAFFLSISFTLIDTAVSKASFKLTIFRAGQKVLTDKDVRSRNQPRSIDTTWVKD